MQSDSVGKLVIILGEIMAMAKHMNIADFENELLFCRQQTLHNTACTQSNTQIRKVNLTNLQLQSYMDRHSIKIKFEV